MDHPRKDPLLLPSTHSIAPPPPPGPSPGASGTPGPDPHWGTQVLRVAECVGVLILTLMLLVPMFLFVPTAEWMRMDIKPISADTPEAGLSAEAVDAMQAAIVDLDVAKRVLAREWKGGMRLSLHGLSQEDLTEFQILNELAERGFYVEQKKLFKELDLETFIESPKWLFGSMLVQGLAFLIVGGIFSRFRGGALGFARRPLYSIGVGVLAGGAAALGGTALATAQTMLGFPVQEQEAILEMIRRVNLWQLAPLLVVLAPVTEELFFRGYVFRYLARTVSLPMGYLVSGVLFSAMHWNPSGFLIYLVVGSAFAWSYRKTDNMLAPIAAHVAYNGVAMMGAVALQLSQSS